MVIYKDSRPQWTGPLVHSAGGGGVRQEGLAGSRRGLRTELPAPALSLVTAAPNYVYILTCAPSSLYHFPLPPPLPSVPFFLSPLSSLLSLLSLFSSRRLHIEGRLSRHGRARLCG
jgi:hypothetical protein